MSHYTLGKVDVPLQTRIACPFDEPKDGGTLHAQEDNLVTGLTKDQSDPRRNVMVKEEFHAQASAGFICLAMRWSISAMWSS
jgi:hypothetical protein